MNEEESVFQVDGGAVFIGILVGLLCQYLTSGPDPGDPAAFRMPWCIELGFAIGFTLYVLLGGACRWLWRRIRARNP